MSIMYFIGTPFDLDSDVTDGDDRHGPRSTPGTILQDRHNGRMSSPTRPAPSRLKVAVALLTVYIVWGSTYLAIAVMIETLPPLVAAGFRFVTAGVLMLGAVVAHARIVRGTSLERPKLVHWRTAAVVGVLLLLGGNGGVVLAELFIPSGVAAVLIATTPIWMAVIEAILDRRMPSWLVIGGLSGGIIGVVILLAPVDPLSRLDPRGIALCIGAEIAWASGSVYAQRAPMPRSSALATGMEMLAGGIALLGAGILLGELGRTDISAFSLNSVLALAYLIIFGSLVAFTAYTWLLANVPTTTASTYAFVNPIVAVALGAILLSEPITPRTLIATAIIIVAVIAMVMGRPQSASEADPAAATHDTDDRRAAAAD
jgi:drug/metabolite transporter (DMT)-like permease